MKFLSNIVEKLKILIICLEFHTLNAILSSGVGIGTLAEKKIREFTVKFCLLTFQVLKLALMFLSQLDVSI